MSKTIAVMNAQESVDPATLFVSLLNSDSSKPAMVIAGTFIALAAFVLAFNMGMFIQTFAFQDMLAELYPLTNTATVSFIFVALSISATIKAGLKNNIAGALIAGSAGAMFLGNLFSALT